MSSFDLDAFYATLPRRYFGSGELITDPNGHVLIVEPIYKESWEIPGGLVEAGEDPRTACTRELQEELGIAIIPGRLLVMNHQTLPPPRGDSIMFVYEGGTIVDPASITLQASELRSFRFASPNELARSLNPRLAARMIEALHARADGRLVELVNGSVSADNPNA